MKKVVFYEKFNIGHRAYIGDFIRKYGKPYKEENDSYHRLPYSGDIKESKTDSLSSPISW